MNGQAHYVYAYPTLSVGAHHLCLAKYVACDGANESGILAESLTDGFGRIPSNVSGYRLVLQRADLAKHYVHSLVRTDYSHGRLVSRPIRYGNEPEPRPPWVIVPRRLTSIASYSVSRLQIVGRAPVTSIMMRGVGWRNR